MSSKSLDEMIAQANTTAEELPKVPEHFEGAEEGAFTSTWDYLPTIHTSFTD